MELKNSPAHRWAEHRYETRQREWHEELTSEQPDWSRLDELEMELRSLKAYLAQLDLNRGL